MGGKGRIILIIVQVGRLERNQKQIPPSLSLSQAISKRLRQSFIFVCLSFAMGLRPYRDKRREGRLSLFFLGGSFSFLLLLNFFIYFFCLREASCNASALYFVVASRERKLHDETKKKNIKIDVKHPQPNRKEQKGEMTSCWEAEEALLLNPPRLVIRIISSIAFFSSFGRGMEPHGEIQIYQRPLAAPVELLEYLPLHLRDSEQLTGLGHVLHPLPRSAALRPTAVDEAPGLSLGCGSALSRGALAIEPFTVFSLPGRLGSGVPLQSLPAPVLRLLAHPALEKVRAMAKSRGDDRSGKPEPPSPASGRRGHLVWSAVGEAKGRGAPRCDKAEAMAVHVSPFGATVEAAACPSFNVHSTANASPVEPICRVSYLPLRRLAGRLASGRGHRLAPILEYKMVLLLV
eukprot:gene7851-5479_t